MMNKTVIITGANSGIGLAAAKKLKASGAEIVLVGRSPEKTKAVADELKAAYYLADFSKLKDVRRLAEELRKACPRIDVLINNAGAILGSRMLTEDGFEKTMQINHLAHFLLTNLLMDILIESKATVINTSSIANRLFARFNIQDLNMEGRYSASMAYGNAKLENILFTKELDRRYGSMGISAVTFHPGIVATGFAKGSSSFLWPLYRTPIKYIAGLISPEKGADTLVWLASTSPFKDWQPGQYYYKRRVAKTNKMAYDLALASSLWDQSQKMVAINHIIPQPH